MPKGVPGAFDRYGAPTGQDMDREPPMAIAQPVHAQQQQQFMVQVPPNVGPGQQIMVQAPSGQQVMVVVPQGVGPGGSFPVSI